MAAYVALLRGINVGGKNPISMQTLADCFRDAGYEEVRTHLQSGNVLFASGSRSGARLEQALERMLQQRFDTAIPTIVRSRDELRATVAAAPADHGSKIHASHEHADLPADDGAELAHHDTSPRAARRELNHASRRVPR